MMKKATIAWDEIGKWALILLLIVALVIVVAILSGSAHDLWDKIASIFQVGG